jgi:prevent-host-death family protein
LSAMKVGTKELKNRLSHYLREVRRGEIVRITDRGQVVAEIRAIAPVEEGDERAALAELEASGLVSPGNRRRFRPVQAVRTRGGVRASRAILEDRG